MSHDGSTSPEPVRISIVQYSEDLPDPRAGPNAVHKLMDIIVIAACAVAAMPTPGASASAVTPRDGLRRKRMPHHRRWPSFAVARKRRPPDNGVGTMGALRAERRVRSPMRRKGSSSGEEAHSVLTSWIPNVH